MTIVGLDHVSVTTGDIARSLAFYRDLLGIPVSDVTELSGAEVEAITGVPGARMLAADLDLGHGQVLELIEYVDGTAGVALPLDHAGSGHIGLAVRDLDALLARLRDAGVEVATEPATITEPGDWFGARCMTVRDPDGVAVELVQRPVRTARTADEASARAD